MSDFESKPVTWGALYAFVICSIAALGMAAWLSLVFRNRIL